VQPHPKQFGNVKGLTNGNKERKKKGRKKDNGQVRRKAIAEMNGGRE